jgi:hypothetical protein
MLLMDRPEFLDVIDQRFEVAPVDVPVKGLSRLVSDAGMTWADSLWP